MRSGRRPRIGPIRSGYSSNPTRGEFPSCSPFVMGECGSRRLLFLRGAAALMAFDLAGTPRTGLRVQACGDCHIMNFGAFATPERNLVFDINDFDETLPAPWEWDVKRLTVSIEVAGRSAGIRSRYREHAVRAAVRSYREHLGEYATMPSLEVWYQRIDFQKLLDRVPGPRNRRRDKRVSERARRKTVPNNLLPSMAARDADQNQGRATADLSFARSTDRGLSPASRIILQALPDLPPGVLSSAL